MGKTEKYDHMKLIRQYAGGHRNLITLGRLLAAVSALLTLIPYYELWKVIRTAVNGEELDDIKGYAWSAVAMIVGALLIYIAALLCTHIAAFRVQANMRSSLMRKDHHTSARSI